MTRIAARKTRLTFEVETLVRGRNLIVEPTPFTVKIREKGRQHFFEVSWEAVYSLAAKIAAEAARLDRKLKRKGLR
jgi:hypothetical protein